MWSTSSRSLSTQTVPCIFIRFVHVSIQPRNVDRLVKRKICISRGYKTIFWALRREIRTRNNILKCSLYLSDNTLHVHYKDHMLNAVQELMIPCSQNRCEPTNNTSLTQNTVGFNDSRVSFN